MRSVLPTASQNSEGYSFFSSRAADEITSAGYRIGPFDVGGALMGIPAVAEAAVVGKPDPIRGETVNAFVVVRGISIPSGEFADELSSFARSKLSAHAYPREIGFIDQLPKSPSGKIQRFMLRSQN